MEWSCTWTVHVLRMQPLPSVESVHCDHSPVDAGVDVLTFGGTKNGIMYGEAILYFTQSANPIVERAVSYAPWARKMTTQLPSKGRFVAAQFEALFTDDLWVRLGGQANAAANDLYGAVRGIRSLGLVTPPAVNSLYPVVADPVADILRQNQLLLALGCRYAARAMDDGVGHNPRRRGCFRGRGTCLHGVIDSRISID